MSKVMGSLATSLLLIISFSTVSYGGSMLSWDYYASSGSSGACKNYYSEIGTNYILLKRCDGSGYYFERLLNNYGLNIEWTSEGTVTVDVSQS